MGAWMKQSLRCGLAPAVQERGKNLAPPPPKKKREINKNQSSSNNNSNDDKPVLNPKP